MFKFFHSTLFVFIFFNSCVEVYGQFSEGHHLVHEDKYTGHASALSSFDLDNDGLDDVIASSNGFLVWYKNYNNGFFSEALEIHPGLFEGGDLMECADIDSDGDVDIVCSNTFYGGLKWYENTGGGGGTFVVHTIENYSQYTAKRIEACDYDNDSDLDLFICFQNTSGEKVQKYENLGGGNFDIPVGVIPFFPSISNLSGMVLMDVNNDGFQDLFVTSSLSDKIRWYENLGGASFSSEQIISNSLESPHFIEAADLNNDGDTDIVVLLSAPQEMVWLENLGGGTFGPPQLISDQLSIQAEEIGIGDIDGDGDSDIALGPDWFENDGAGAFSVHSSGENYLTGQEVAFLTDIDSDSDIDILNSSWFVSYKLNDGLGSFEKTHFINYRIQEPQAVNFSDLNNDGFTDLLVGSDFEGKINWLSNDGFNDFKALTYFENGGAFTNVQYMFPGDLDNDGDSDIVFTTNTQSAICWYENLGNGEFTTETVISHANGLIRDMKLGDLDGNGFQDVIISAHEDSTVFYIPNLGGGLFGSKSLIDTSGYVFSVELNDLDNDGDNDLVLGKSNPFEIVVYKNNGSGVFDSEDIVSTNFPHVLNLKLCDIDNDSDDDIIVLSESDKRVSCFLNLGGGNYSQEVVISNVFSTTLKIYCHDYDNDGDIDVLMHGTEPYILSWVENLGNLNFELPQLIEVSAAGPITRVSVGDYDSDSDPDVFFSEHSQDVVTLLENKSVSNFQVKGTLYIDYDQNGVLDSGDFPVSIMDVLISQPSNDYYMSGNGEYFVVFEDTTSVIYTLEPNLIDNPYWSITSDSTSYTFLIDGSFQNLDSIDFGLYPDTNIYEVQIDLVGSPPNCDDTVSYWVQIENSGTVPVSGVLCLDLDDSLEYYYSDFPIDSIVNDCLFWSFDTLDLFEKELFKFEIVTPTFLSIGDTLISTVKSFVDTSQLVISDCDTTAEILTCAYDPNDKIVFPSGVDSLGYFSADINTMEYTIRFQNTGNDTAQTVVIKDQLHIDLDWESFEMIGSSHNTIAQVYPNGLLIFSMNDIMLPDSIVDYTGSQGFVKFKIDRNASSQIGNTITNSAEIYFDFNPAVITNVTNSTPINCKYIAENSTVDSPSCSDEEVLGYNNIYPSGFQSSWVLPSLDVVVNDSMIWIADSSGVLSIPLHVESSFCQFDTSFVIEINDSYFASIDTIEICNGETFLFEGSFIDSAGFYEKTYTNSSGCDSILYLNLIINPTDEFVMPVQEICEGDSILIFDSYESTPGVYVDSMQNVFGCDSVVLSELIVHDNPTVIMSSFDDDSLCQFSAPIQLIGNPSGGSFIGPGVTGDIFDPSISGPGEHYLYYSYSTLENCVSIDSVLVHVSDCLSFTSSESSNFQIIPNPFNEETHIIFGKELSQEYLAVIYDLLGRKVFQTEVYSGSNLILTKSDLSSGTYTFNLINKNSGKVEVTQLIISE